VTDLRIAGHDLELAATAYGDPANPPVVLLHGGGQTRHAWGTAGNAFAARGRYALSVDLRGHGDSQWAPDGDYGMGAFASDVLAVSAALPQRPALVGASLGGLASLVAVGESDDPVATALVLVDVTPMVEMDGAMRIRNFMLEGMGGFKRLEDAADAIAAYIRATSRGCARTCVNATANGTGTGTLASSAAGTASTDRKGSSTTTASPRRHGGSASRPCSFADG